MFCYQCQENAGNQGCRFTKGVCGKPDHTSNLMDMMLWLSKGIAIYAEKQPVDAKYGRFITEAFFATITNANFDDERLLAFIHQAMKLRHEIAAAFPIAEPLPEAATWQGSSEADFRNKAEEVGVLATENEDVRSLRELIIYGVKGMCAYAHHAEQLGFEDPTIYAFIYKALASTLKDLSVDELVALTLETGAVSAQTMALLDKANTETYGHPEVTEVNIGVGSRPGILVSGHDLRDLQELLEQSKGAGIDIYTHGEMLPAHYYPELKKYDHLVGNYGGAWFLQNTEFASFNGAILLTTNCLVPVKDGYKDRLFTTGVVGWPGVKHISDRKANAQKDFSAIIELAKTCPPPTEIETGKIVGGFAHNQVIALADKVVDAVKSGAIKRFVVMAGCDGRHKTRNYFTDVARELPKDTIILTAGCAKYRYNKLQLGDIGGIPRVLDAGQCNDSYSLAVIALKLKEVFGLDDVNDLPLSFDIAWYEQKAVTVLLALLALGFKNIRLGPTLPAFLSPNVVKVLVENFDIKPTGDAAEDVAAMMKGE
ncbi:MAG: hydroxylamine reductase [Candidatus Cloacimonetes bacterium]|nr:hydroxylamine reductase [Candidatus Cloacimonadota bacterium]